MDKPGFPVPDLELRDATSPIEISLKKPQQPRLGGVPIAFGQLSAPMRGLRGSRVVEFRERVMPGALDRFLDERPEVYALREHDWSKVLGRLSIGTLNLALEERGVVVEINPPNTTVARDTVEDVRSGHVDGMSFGFKAYPNDGERWIREDGQLVRELVHIRVPEVTVTSQPVYRGAFVATRSRQGSDLNLDEIADSLPLECRSAIDAAGTSLEEYDKLQLQLAKFRRSFAQSTRQTA